MNHSHPLLELMLKAYSTCYFQHTKLCAHWLLAYNENSSVCYICFPLTVNLYVRYFCLLPHEVPELDLK